MRTRATRDLPPPLELLCLNALWTLRQGNVQDVRNAVAGKKALAYTTVMTILERLVKRNLVARQKSGRSFVYTPQTTRDSIRRIALKEFVDCHFDGSEEQLMAYLNGPQPVAAAPASMEAEPRLDAVLL